LIPPPALLGYEVWTPLSEYDRAEDISQMMEQKLQAVRAHRLQIKQIRYDRAINALNEYCGTMTQVGRYAEVFEFADDRFATIRRSRRTDPAWHRAYDVTQEIAKLVPPQDAFILVDEGRLEAAPLHGDVFLFSKKTDIIGESPRMTRPPFPRSLGYDSLVRTS